MKWLSLLLLMCVACTKHPAPTPRPQAYPRIELYPQQYHAAEILGKTLQINDSARLVEGDRPGWFNIIYPAYGVTVNATLTLAPSDQIDAILGNRTERMARNLGGVAAELTQGPGITVITAPTALSTPVQLLATDSLTWVLSATAVSSWSLTTATDSVVPIIDALRADMLQLGTIR